MAELLAKSITEYNPNGIGLKEHSILVSKFAVEIAKSQYRFNDKELLEVVRVIGLLHDIGKCPKEFQKILRKKPGETKKQKKTYHTHNEIGWAFLKQNLSFKSIFGYTDYMLDSVYWHHGLRDKKNYNKQTVKDIKINDNDNKTMLLFMSSILNGSEYISHNENVLKHKVPSYYVEDVNDNTYKTFIRHCIIKADELASEMDGLKLSDEEIHEIVVNLSLRKSFIDI